MAEKILRAAVIGLGGQGRGHVKAYLSHPELTHCELVAVCDVNPEKFELTATSNTNLESNKGGIDFSSLAKYTDYREMLEKERLDFVDIAVPTYLHREITVACLKAGLHVLCEKPMGLSLAECDEMIATAKETGKKLMIGQTLRFWPEYDVLRSMIASGEYGKVTAGIFHRGGGIPSHSYKDWYYHKACGGGAIIDQHIHDVDIIQAIFGTPDAVSTNGKILHEDTLYDTLCTNYLYQNGPMIMSHNDWTLHTPFEHGFRVNFERGTLEMRCGTLTFCPPKGKPEPVEFEKRSPLGVEIGYFADYVNGLNDESNNPPEASRETIRIVLAEVASADRFAEPVKL